MSNGSYCPACRKRRRRPSAAARGYGHDHRKLRETTPKTPCIGVDEIHCDAAWEPSFHLDHLDGDPGNTAAANLGWRCPSHHSVKTNRYDGGFGRPRRTYPRSP